MNRNIALSLAAGLLGGLLSHYAFVVLPVQAQSPAPPRSVTSQSFVLMNDKGEVGGTFSFNDEGKPVIQLFEHGRPTWSAGGKVMRPLGK